MENLKHGSRKPNVKVNGLVNVNGMKFHDIEGGFGVGKKSILAKEIANIHGRELRVINQAINMNRTRFTDGLDIVDLKGTEFAINLIDSGIYTQNSLNASSNIYLLSERGYSKLLKILEDDFAWEQYDKLVDGYFNMREQVIKNPYSHLSKEVQAIFALDHKQQQLAVEVKELKEGMPLFNVECKEIQAAVKRKDVEILGGKGSPAYKNNSIRCKVYSDIQQQLRREFGVSRYEAIKRSQLNMAHEIVAKYKAPIYLTDEIYLLNQPLSDEDYAI